MATVNPIARRGTVRAWRVVIWGGAAMLLALPWVAMRFTREVNWTLSDFVVFGLMLACACGAAEWVLRRVHDATARRLALAAVAATFVLVWAALAVG